MMTTEEMKHLEPGDLIHHVGDHRIYVVTANYGDRVTAVRSVDVTNPAEWDLLNKRTTADDSHTAR